MANLCLTCKNRNEPCNRQREILVCNWYRPTDAERLRTGLCAKSYNQAIVDMSHTLINAIEALSEEVRADLGINLVHNVANEVLDEYENKEGPRCGTL